MKIESHSINQIRIAEIIADEIIIHSAADGLNILGDIYYQGFDSVIVYEKNITPDFFQLANGMAGEALQKFSNYRVRLAIVGDFGVPPSKSLKQFIFESNKTGHINFVSSLNEAILKLTT
ncbi:MAG: DUF4180 domain-containing protein [Cytophagales bacterium]|nr:DUF4180 domain-containing protein [Cytophagales bacterium]